MELIQKYQKLIQENQDQKEYYLKMWVDKDALNGYDIHIRLYSQFIRELEDLQKSGNQLEAEVKTLNGLRGKVTKFTSFINWFTTNYRKVKDWMWKLEFLETAVIKAGWLRDVE